MPRYTVSGIPEHLAAGSELGLSAFLPHFNRLAASGAQAYKGQVAGFPGTLAVGVQPGVQGIPPSPDPGDIVQMGTARSSDAPNAIWPNLYYDNPAAQGPNGQRFYPGAGMPIQLYDPTRPEDTTMIPVPATDLRGVYQAHSAKLAGGVAPNQGGGWNDRAKALKQMTNFARWPKRRQGNGPGTGSP